MSYNTLRIYGLLSTLILLVPLIALSCFMQYLVGYAKEDLAISYTDVRQTLGVFDSILDIFEGKPFEHQIEIDANQIFPNESLKNEIAANSTSLEFTMPVLNYDLLGFNISASNIEVNASSKQVSDDSNKKRIDFPVMLAKTVNVSNEIIKKNFTDVDLSSIYAIYDSKTDKLTFHIPFDMAARYLIKGS
ncbi:MAG: hypothetical protein ACRD8Z_09755 [Nitrososphaeraceae archaeon]